MTKSHNVVEVALLEHCARELLNKTAERRMAVLKPLKVTIENYPEGESEDLEAVNNPEDPGAGTRSVPFAREIYIERDDFMEEPPKKFFRLAPGREVRLRYAYFVTCVGIHKDESGEIGGRIGANRRRRRMAARRGFASTAIMAGDRMHGV